MVPIEFGLLEMEFSLFANYAVVSSFFVFVDFGKLLNVQTSDQSHLK